MRKLSKTPEAQAALVWDRSLLSPSKYKVIGNIICVRGHNKARAAVAAAACVYLFSVGRVTDACVDRQWRVGGSWRDSLSPPVSSSAGWVPDRSGCEEGRPSPVSMDPAGVG